MRAIYFGLSLIYRRKMKKKEEVEKKEKGEKKYPGGKAGMPRLHKAKREAIRSKR